MKARVRITLARIDNPAGRRFDWLRFGWLMGAAAAGALVVNLLVACGVIGPPIPPEDIGIAAKIEREKRETAPEAPERALGGEGLEEPTKKEVPGPPEETEPEDVQLPPLRPVGTQ